VSTDPASTPAALRHRAETHASAYPALLAEAEHLAATILLGDHGRRRAGVGDEFWQYRPAERGDGLRDIDWRRSARSDDQFVRQKEWQAAQSVMLWVDDALSMTFSGGKDRPTKGHRARVLALALCVLLNRGGERFGLASVLPAGSRAVFLSDFLGDPTAAELALTQAADRGVKGAIVQVLDPDEEAFPFDGRTLFTTMSGAVEFETLKANSLKEAYLDRLAARKDHLKSLARKTGWRFHCHHTDQPATKAMLWLYQAMERG